MTLFVAESIDEARLRKLFTLLAVDYFATARAWMNPPLMAAVGIVLALLIAPPTQLPGQILVGIGYGLLIMLASFCHGLGHIFSSRMVHAPVASIYLTATVGVIHFDDHGEQPSRVHVGRALGGPLFNLMLGLIALAIYMLAVHNQFLLFFGAVNLLFGIMTLLPIPSLDGAAIWRELRNWHQ